MVRTWDGRPEASCRKRKAGFLQERWDNKDPERVSCRDVTQCALDFLSLAPCPESRCMKIRRLAYNPVDKAPHCFIGTERICLRLQFCQLGVGEKPVDRAMADRVNRRRVPPAFAFWHRVMPFHAHAKRPAAQPAAVAGFRRYGIHPEPPLRPFPALTRVSAPVPRCRYRQDRRDYHRCPCG